MDMSTQNEIAVAGITGENARDKKERRALPFLALPFDYVTLPLLSSMTGYSPGALQKKIERGDWLEGVHYVRAPDGRIQVNLAAYRRWVEGEPASIVRDKK